MAVVYAAPAPTDQPDVLWTGLDMSWTGWDGSTFSLVDPDQGTVMLPGVRGLSMPSLDHFADTYASVPGSRWRGYQVKEREVFWPIQLYTDAGSQAWLERDRAFWHSLHPRRTGLWQVTQPDGTTRSLRLRFKDDGTQQYDVDPSLSGWSNYGITLVASQPFWEGAPIVQQWASGAGSNFFGSTGGPAFVISPSNTLSTANITNPGDEAAWPTWILDGPFTDFSIQVAGKTVSGSVSVGAGHQLVIETNPTIRSAMVDGTTDVMAQLSQYGFYPLADNVDTPLGLSLSGGNGSITCRFTPLHHRAW